MDRVHKSTWRRQETGNIQIIVYWRGAVTSWVFSSRSCEIWEAHSHGLMCLLNAWNNNVISNPNLEHLGPDQSASLPNDTCFTTSDGYYLMCTWGCRLCFWSRVHQLDPQLYVWMLMLMDPWVQQTMPKLWMPSPTTCLQTLSCFLI